MNHRMSLPEPVRTVDFKGEYYGKNTGTLGRLQ